MALAVSRTRDELAADYTDLDRLYSAFLRDYTPEQLAWRPIAGSWSVAECIEHVARVNALYLAVMEGAIAGGAPSALQGGPLRTAGWPSAYFLRSISPDGRTKLKSPGKARPRAAGKASIDPEDALRRLLATHEKIRGLLASTTQLDLNHLRFKNPFIPLLRFTVATGFLVMAGHGHRHHLQAQRVCDSPDFPQANGSTRDKAL